MGRRHNASADVRRRAVDAYVGGDSLAVVASREGYDPSAVWRWIVAAGVETRPRAGGPRPRGPGGGEGSVCGRGSMLARREVETWRRRATSRAAHRAVREVEGLAVGEPLRAGSSLLGAAGLAYGLVCPAGREEAERLWELRLWETADREVVETGARLFPRVGGDQAEGEDWRTSAEERASGRRAIAAAPGLGVKVVACSPRHRSGGRRSSKMTDADYAEKLRRALANSIRRRYGSEDHRAERDRRIVDLYRSGLDADAVAAEVEMSAGHVREIVRRSGVERRVRRRRTRLKKTLDTVS